MKQIGRKKYRGFILIFMAVFFLCCGNYAKAEDPSEKVIDSLDKPEGWALIGKKIKTAAEKGIEGDCLCLEYSLSKAEAFVVISKDMSLALPENYELSFYIKGAGPENNIELKLIDREGNTYWRRFSNFKFTSEWQKIVIPAYEITFAWGPSPNKLLKEVSKIEFAVTYGFEGEGKVCIDKLSVAALPAEKIMAESLKAVKVEASSFTEEALGPKKAFDGDMKNRWSSDASDPQWLTVDLGENKTVDKAVIFWEAAYAKKYQIQGSIDGKDWRVLSTVDYGSGGKNVISFQPVSVRFLRMFGMERGSPWGYSILEFKVYKSDSAPAAEVSGFAKFDLNSTLKRMAESAKLTQKPIEYFKIKAKISPPGYYPKWINGKQAYWTITGTRSGVKDSLVSEDGMINSYMKGFSLMPYLYIDGKLITADDAIITQALEDSYLPIPSITWKYEGLTLEQKVFDYGKAGEPDLYMEYKLKNEGPNKIRGKLYLTLRPFDVNPPWMYGGEADIYSIKRDKSTGVIDINDRDRLLPLMSPDGFGALSYERGEIVESISAGKLPSGQNVSDRSGFASGALRYNFKLPPQGERKFLFVVSFDMKKKLEKISEEQFSADLEETKNTWRKDLGAIKINIPEKRLIDVMRSNLAYILINRNGPSLQPGPGNYAKCWVRDGAVMSAALLRNGYSKEVKEYISWTAKHQKESGEIPAILSTDGSIPYFSKDWIEYDGQGEFVFAVGEYYRFTKDKEFVKEVFPSVLKALKFLEALRAQMLADQYKETASYGIIPKSHSHEGYIGNPQQSLWDDYWALKGWKDGRMLAEVLGRTDEIDWMKKEEEGLRENLLKDIELVRSRKNIAYIPASIGLADFDPTSTSISVWPTEESRYLPKEELLYTLDKYYKETFSPRLARGAKYGYVPYEIRTANAYLILGEKEKCLTMLRYFLTDMRPQAWNHWAEVVLPVYREPKYIGDMPHSWIGAIYINTVRNLFVHEEDDKLMLGIGIDEKWLAGEEGVSIGDFPTYYGDISYSVKKEGDGILRIMASGNAAPPQGFVFKVSIPAEDEIKEVALNGEKWQEFSGRDVTFHSLPADIIVYHSRKQ